MNWFYRFSRRDQYALLLCGVAMFTYTLWFGMLRPTYELSAGQDRRTSEVAATLVRVQGLAAEISRLEQSGAGSPRQQINLSQLVDRSLKKNQLMMSGFQPGRDGDVRLRLESADFERFLQWLYEIESGHRVRIGELSIMPTRQQGIVSVQIQLLGPGA